MNTSDRIHLCETHRDAVCIALEKLRLDAELIVEAGSELHSCHYQTLQNSFGTKELTKLHPCDKFGRRAFFIGDDRYATARAVASLTSIFDDGSVSTSHLDEAELGAIPKNERPKVERLCRLLMATFEMQHAEGPVEEGGQEYPGEDNQEGTAKALDRARAASSNNDEWTWMLYARRALAWIEES